MNHLAWAKFKTPTTSNADEEVEQQELSFIAGGNAKWYSPHQNTVWQFLENLNILLPCHQVIQSLAFTQRSKLVENLCLHKHLHIDIYSSFSYNCPNLEANKISSSMWMAKVQHIQTKQYLGTKRNTLPSNVNTWEKFKCILLSKRSQSEKATYCLIPVIWTF